MIKQSIAFLFWWLNKYWPDCRLLVFLKNEFGLGLLAAKDRFTLIPSMYVVTTTNLSNSEQNWQIWATWQVWHIWANLSDSEYPDSWNASVVILSRAAKGILIQLFLSNILLQYTFSIIQYLPPVFYVFYLNCFVGGGRWIVKARLGAFAARSRTRFCFLTGRLPVFAS